VRQAVATVSICCACCCHTSVFCHLHDNCFILIAYISTPAAATEFKTVNGSSSSAVIWNPEQGWEQKIILHYNRIDTLQTLNM
jgi:hypothetical protein